MDTIDASIVRAMSDLPSSLSLTTAVASYRDRLSADIDKLRQRIDQNRGKQQQLHQQRYDDDDGKNNRKNELQQQQQNPAENDSYNDAIHSRCVSMPTVEDSLPPAQDISVHSNFRWSPLCNRKSATSSSSVKALRGTKGTTSQQQQQRQYQQQQQQQRQYQYQQHHQYRQHILNTSFLEERRKLQEQYELGMALQNHQMMTIRRAAAYKPNEIPYYLLQQHQQQQHHQQYQGQQHTHQLHLIPPSLLTMQQSTSSLPLLPHLSSPSLLRNFPGKFPTSINIGGSVEPSSATTHGGGCQSTFSLNLKNSTVGNNDISKTMCDSAELNSNPTRNISENINRKRSVAGRRRKETERGNDNSTIDNRRNRKRAPSDIPSRDNKTAKKTDTANTRSKLASSLFRSLYADLQSLDNQQIRVQQYDSKLPSTKHQTVQQIHQQQEQQQLMNRYTGTQSTDTTGNNGNHHHQNFHGDDDGAYYTSRSSRRFPEEKRKLSKNFIPGTNTVVLGKGNVPKTNEGNLKLKGLIMDSLTEYSNGERREKINATTKIICHVRDKNATNNSTTSTPTTGFVKYEDACWWEMTERDARVKVTALFRDSLHNQYRSSSTSKVRRRQQLRNYTDSNNSNNNNTTILDTDD